MTSVEGPRVLLLDGDYDNTLQIARELSEDLDAWVIGVGTNRVSRLFHSRYCDETAIVSRDDGYAESLRALIADRRPDVVLPVGYESVAAVDVIRDRIPDDITFGLPPSESLEIATDKRRTMTLARSLDVPVPREYTDRVASIATGHASGGIDALPRPLILKARRETGDSLSTKVEASDDFWAEYESLRRRAGGDQILVQECLTGDGRTYGCGLLFDHGTPKMLFEHVELRSVPRHGGSGTRLRVFRDPHLESMSIQLLQALDWHGVALVEFRRTDDGYTLMEINPKFWASYALASQCGYRFASSLVAEALDLSHVNPSIAPDRTGERVFPLRELVYCAQHADQESFLECLTSMVWPPTRPDIDVRDLPAWLMPPADVVHRVRPDVSTRSLPALITRTAETFRRR